MPSSGFCWQIERSLEISNFYCESKYWVDPTLYVLRILLNVYCRFDPGPQAANRDILEQKLIQHLQPPMNVQYR